MGPATVAGLAAGTVAVVAEPQARLLGVAAGGPAWWIVEVARHGAALPYARGEPRALLLLRHVQPKLQDHGPLLCEVPLVRDDRAETVFPERRGRFSR